MTRAVSVSVSVSVSNPAVTKNKIVTEHTEEESVTERIVTQIRDKIICGDLPPGTALTEADLTKAYDVSRNTLREALRQICREGLAMHYRHRGVVVRTLTRTDVRDIFRVRRTLELQAIALPAKPDPAVLHAMAAGLIGEDHVLGEIGEVMAGTKSGRLSGADVTIYKSLGAIVQDLASGWFIYRRAVEMGLGVDAAF